ncbi:hypothetical protein BASA60_003477 [Batrachochytrium salamandrivorans]|nr:hypothetical protein BASA60_003477 [Batrachochytrium salamandrivorans]
MKLAAAAILSLVATAAYASPVAYSENQVSAQYSAADESRHRPPRKAYWKTAGFMERISEIQDSVNHDHHQQGHQQEQDSQQGQTHPRNDYQRLLQERQRQREEEQRLLQQRLKDQREEEQRLLQQRLQDQQTTRTRRATKTTTRTRGRGRISPKTEISHGNSAGVEGDLSIKSKSL